MGSSVSEIGSSNDAPPSADRTPPVIGNGARGYYCGECGGNISTRSSCTIFKTCTLCKTKRTMHDPCFKRYLGNTKLDKTMTAESWQADTNLHLWCAGCMVPCFVCNKKKQRESKSKHTKHNFNNAGAEKVLCSICKLKWCVMLNSGSASEKDKKKKFCGHVTENHNYTCAECDQDNRTSTTLDPTKGRVMHHDKHKRPFFVVEGTKLPNNVKHTANNVYQDETTVIHKNCRNKPKAMEMDTCDCNEKAGTSGCCDVQCLNYALYYECPTNCTLGNKCQNQRMRRNFYKKLTVYDSGSAKGLAVMNQEVINEDEYICEYTGVVIDLSAAMGSKTTNCSSYCIGNKDIMIDAEVIGSVARYINHSCDPNCVVIPWVVDGYYHLGIFAKRYINKREELTIDYKWEAKPGQDKITCLCGAKNCRTTVHSFNKHDLGWIFMEENGQWHQTAEAPNQPVFWQLAGDEKTEPENDSFSQKDNEWMTEIETIINHLNSDFDAAFEPDNHSQINLSDNLLSVIDGLRKNIRSCKGKSKKVVYKFMTDLTFIPIQKVEGYQFVEDKESLVHILNMTNSSVLWIAANEVFGSHRIEDKQIGSYDIESKAVTNLGKKIFKRFSTLQDKLEGYSKDSLFGDGHNVPHEIVKRMKNRDKTLFKTLTQTKPLERFLYSLLTNYLENYAMMTDVDESLCFMTLRFQLTKPEAFIMTDDGKVPATDISLVWTVTQKLLGSKWVDSQASNDGDVSHPNYNVDHFDTNAPLIRLDCKKGALSGGMQYDAFSVTDNNQCLKKIVRKPVDDYKKQKYKPPVAREYVSRLLYHFDTQALNDIYDEVESCFGLQEQESISYDEKYETFDLCHQEIINNFSMMELYQDNIFSMNRINKKHDASLFLSRLSLLRLICKHDEGDIDDCILNFVAELLNFYMSWDRNLYKQSTKEPRVLFLSTYDDVLHLNPSYTTSLHYENLYLGHLHFGVMPMDKYIPFNNEIESWYYSCNYSELSRFFWMAKKKKWSLQSIHGSICKGSQKFQHLKLKMPTNDEKWSVTTTGTEEHNHYAVDYKQSRVFIAKYISLKRDEMEGKKLSFDLGHLLPSSSTGEESNITHTHKKPSTYYSEVSEGVFVINEWLNEIKGGVIEEKFNCDHLRKAIFTLVMRIYDEIWFGDINDFYIPDQKRGDEKYILRLQDVGVIINTLSNEDRENLCDGIRNVLLGNSKNFQKFLLNYKDLLPLMQSDEARDLVELEKEKSDPNYKRKETKTPNLPKLPPPNTRGKTKYPKIDDDKVLSTSDGSGKINVLTTSKVKLEEKGNKVKLVELLKFFMKQCFKVNTLLEENMNMNTMEERRKIKPLHKYIDKCVHSNTTYFMICNVLTEEYKVCDFGSKCHGNLRDFPNNSRHIQIVAVLNLEKLVMVKTKKCSLIHFLCVHPKFRSSCFGAILLSTVWKSGVFAENRVYAVKRLPLMWTHVTCEDAKTLGLPNSNHFFSKFGFNSYKGAYRNIWEDCDDLEKLVLEGSFYAWIEAGNLQNVARSYLKKGEETIENKFLFFQCSSEEKNMVQWKKKEKKFVVFNKVFGWTDATQEELQSIPIYKRNEAKNKALSGAVNINLSGHRKTHLVPFKDAAGIEIPQQMKQSSYPTESNCVYLAAAITIHFDSNEKCAMQMIRNIENNPVRYNEMRIFQTYKSKTMSLQKVLEQDYSGIMLRKTVKIAGHTNTSRLEYVLEQGCQGIFVALLEDNAGFKTHTVGLNLQKREIYDCMENCVMRLTRENLGYCCGPDKQIKGIEVLAEMILINFRKGGNKRKVAHLQDSSSSHMLDDRKPKGK